MKMQFSWDVNNQHDGKREEHKIYDTIQTALNEKYVAPIQKSRPEEKEHINRWNILRAEVNKYDFYFIFLIGVLLA